MLAIAAARGVVEARFLNALLRDVYDFFGVDIPERTLLDRASHGLLEGVPGQPDEPLPVGVALSLRIEPTIDDVHANGLIGDLSRPCSRACTTRPTAASAGPCSRG